MVAPLIGAGIGLAGRFAAQYGAPLVGAAARQIAGRQAASTAASGAGRSLLGSVPRALRGAAVGGAAQVAGNLIPSGSTNAAESEVESDNTAALTSSEEITTPIAQTATTEIAPLSPSKEGDISSKLSDSPVIALLRSIDNSMKELKDALMGTKASTEGGGGTSGISGLMGPRAAGISGSLLLALAPAIAEFFDRISNSFNQGAANREEANNQAAENRLNMSPRQASGAGNPGQEQANTIRRGYNASNEQIADIQNNLDTPELNEPAELTQERLNLRRDFEAASQQGNQNPEVTPALQEYLENRRIRESQILTETGAEQTYTAPADPDVVRRVQERTQATSQATARAAAAIGETQERLAERAVTEQQALRREPTPEQIATFDEEERRQAERAAARGPGVVARTISAITGLFSPRAFTQPTSQRAADVEASRTAAAAEAETLFPQGNIEPVTPGEQSIRALSAPAAQPQPVVINAQNAGAAPMPVSMPGSGMQTQGGGLPPPGSTPPRIDAAHPEMISQSPAVGRGYAP